MQASRALHLGGRGFRETQRLHCWRDPHNFSACQDVQGTFCAAALQPHAIDAPQRKRWARRGTNKWPSAHSHTYSASWSSSCSRVPFNFEPPYAVEAPPRQNAPRRPRRYQTTKIRSAAELETNLEKMGKDLGKRVLDALFHRDRLTKRELTEVGILQFISTTAWKALWGKAADSLERSNDREDEYMIVDSVPLVNQFVSVPANLGALDCAALMAGVVAGILVCARRPIRYRRDSPIRHRRDSPLTPRRTAPTSLRSVPRILERKEGPCSSFG